MERHSHTTTLGVSDKVLNLGSARSREWLNELPSTTLNQLRDIFPFEVPINTMIVPKSRYQLGTGVTLAVQGMVTLGCYSTYALDGEVWIEVDETRIDPKCAYVGTMALDRVKLMDRNKELQLENASMSVDLQLTRHELERCRPAIIRPQRYGNFALFVLFFFPFLYFRNKS